MRNIFIRQKQQIIGATVFAVVLFLYVATLAPTLTQKHLGIDSGDLLTAAFNFGVPHPTGYPTYIILLKLFSVLIPFGNFALKGNLFSALLGATSCILVYYIIINILSKIEHFSARNSVNKLLVATFGAIALGTSPLFWSQSSITEVYTLNSCFIGLLILLSLNISYKTNTNESLSKFPKQMRLLTLFGFVLGIGIGNHLTIILLIPPIMFWLILKIGWQKLLSPTTLLGLASGLMIYLYIPIAATQTPVVNWGDADNLKGFIWLITGNIYGNNLSISTFPNQLFFTTKLLIQQINITGLFLGITGIFYLGKHNLSLLVTTLSFLILILAYSALYIARDSEVYIIPAVLIFSIWIGIGSYFIIEGLLTYVPKQISKLSRFGLLASIVIAGFIAIPGLNILFNYDYQNLRGDYSDYNYYRNIVDELPTNTVLITDSDEDTFGLWYMSYVDNARPDIVVIAMPLLQFNWYWEDLSKLFPQNMPKLRPKQFNDRLISIAKYNNNQNFPVYTTYNDATLNSHFTLNIEGNVYTLQNNTE